MKSGSFAIRNGLLIDPAEHLEGKYDLLLKDGRVVEVASTGKLRGKADDTFNARGLIVAPGIVIRPARRTGRERSLFLTHFARSAGRAPTAGLSRNATTRMKTARAEHNFPRAA